MLLSDTRTNTKKEFTPLQNKHAVDLFVCGPTVYDHAHIGHARTYIVFDAFVKYLRHKEYKVTYIQNITNIDDKIIARAKEQKRSALSLAEEFEKEYYADMHSLGIDSVSSYARATDYIPQIITQIETLIEKKHAYKTKRGVYFEVATFAKYGELSGQDVDKLESQEEMPDKAKKHVADFALWKNGDDEPTWESPWGPGRPGWPIEDTAITQELLGEQYDIHGGARDLLFPHHEAEIAQMESISGKRPLVNYWMHTGFLTVNGEKMSKSEGNFITIREALNTWDKETFRLFILTKHYRSPVVYAEDAQKEFAAQRSRIEEFSSRLEGASGKTGKDEVTKISEHIEMFWNELADDFNTPKAFGVLFELINMGNTLLDTESLGAKEAGEIGIFLDDMNSIFGIANFEAAQVPSDVKKLVAERETAREDKDWEKSDELRKEIEDKGYIVKDTSSGPVVSRK